ncbi:MAG: ABC transporter permease [Alphaproteobacteria bacterium]|jgi:peptide/nickel transport system permease protein|nr:ABC transporter permease [Alphaproteobacteria bacterium]
MLAYIIRRLIYMIPVLFVVTVVVFSFVELLPGDIVETLIGEEDVEDPEVRKALIEEFGLDQPIYVRYGKWLYRVVQGDLGKSLITRRDVSLELFDRIPATAYLGFAGMLLSMLIAIPLGTLAALKRNSPIDNAVQLFALAGISIPEFWFAIMAIMLISLHLGWLPTSGYTSPIENLRESIEFLILPAIAVGFRQAAYTTRLTRSSMLDEMNKEYVDAARSLGFSEAKVNYKYTLRNAMIPTLTISGLQLADLLGGTVVLEVIFAWPGVGRVIYEAIIQRDYPMIQSGVLVLGFFVVVVNLLVDIAYRWLNPRVELQ